MATVPTPEKSARHILNIFLEFNRRPGDVLGSHNFTTGFFENPWKAADFEPGIEYAAQQKWVEILPDEKYRLTDTGFAEAGGTVLTPENSARHILGIFLSFNRRAGDVLGSHNFNTGFFETPWRAADFQPGIEYAAQQKWVEILPDGQYRLTDRGFSEAE